MSNSSRRRPRGPAPWLVALAALLFACTASYGPWNVEDEPGTKPVEEPVCRTGNEPGCEFDNPMCVDPGDAECMGAM